MGEEKKQTENRHWVEPLAQRIVEQKKPPFTITAGMTTSGPFHLGTLCEMLYPSVLQDYLNKQGHETNFIFFADIMDAFDSVPSVFSQFEPQLAPHLGKPLVHVPDPLGCCESLGDHFLNEALEIAKKFELAPKIKRVNEAYDAGEFDKHASFYLKNARAAREAVFKSSLKEDKGEYWNPIMPVCQNCGKIATTRVTEFNEDSYTYICDKDAKYVKGCGFSGSNRLSDHKYKITWRLHWPAWMDIYSSSSEGGGVDHHTRGGSWDTVVEVFGRLFQKEPPIPYKFGFILLQGKKYSKSKGTGMGVTEVVQLVPPDLLKYALLKPDVQENKDFDPNGVNMLRLYEDYQGAGLLEAAVNQTSQPNLSRADRKREIAFSLATKKLKFKAKFLDVLLNYQLYKDWSKVAEMTEDVEGVRYLEPFISKWLELKFAPEEYLFDFKPAKPQLHKEAVESFLSSLTLQMSPEDIHNQVFSTAKGANLPPAELFKALYNTLIGKDRGPKLGKLIHTIGIKRTKESVLSA